MQDTHQFEDVHLGFTPPPAEGFIVGDPLPNIPSLVATRLQLELLLQDSSIDLGAVSQVILSDAGATLQLLRLVGEEFADDESRPTRIEDCIASINMQHCYQAVCANCISPDSGVTGQWQRSRRLANCAKELAKCIDGFSPEEAYLVGLLYEVGKFPKLLGWKCSEESRQEQEALGIMLADYWHLPGYLLSAICEQQGSSARPRWAEFLQMAELAAETSISETAQA